MHFLSLTYNLNFLTEKNKNKIQHNAVHFLFLERSFVFES